MRMENYSEYHELRTIFCVQVARRTQSMLYSFKILHLLERDDDDDDGGIKVKLVF